MESIANIETTVIWKEGMVFEGSADGFSVLMDAMPPLGRYEGINPKELMIMAAAGCAGMDVIGLLVKNKQKVDNFLIEVDATSTNEHPIIFSSINLLFKMQGLIDPNLAYKAVELSQTVYSGVSAMLWMAAPIKWTLFVNGVNVGEGEANFDIFKDKAVYQTSFEG